MSTSTASGWVPAAQTMLDRWRRRGYQQCLLSVALLSLLLSACSSTPSRPTLGTFTSDEREVAYLQKIHAISPTTLETPEAVYTALSLYRGTKFRQQALFRQFYQQYPQATPQEMTLLVRDAVARESGADRSTMPPPEFQCSSMTAGKLQVLSCN